MRVKSFRSIIDYLLKVKFKSKTDIADSMGVTPQQLNGWYNGNIRIPLVRVIGWLDSIGFDLMVFEK